MDMPTKKPTTASKWVDPDEAPHLTREWFATADLYDGDKLIRKGGAPRKAAPKEAVNIRLDPEVLAYFRGGGPGWQSRINEALRKAAGL
jgi:uncharacterized protein (DUF4415 family)